MKTEKDVELYLVKTDTQQTDGKIRETDYRVLACSAKEAIEIVEESCEGIDETVVHCQIISHITGLPSNRYEIHDIFTK
jgi:hypothetical protein